jgi:diphosphomevalonate decarboxylase
MKFEIRNLEPGTITWRSPSNIALIKYWGKKPGQIPANPSLSMTLNKAYTEMSFGYFLRDDQPARPRLEFLFEGKKQEKFEKKILDYLDSLLPAFPGLGDYVFSISSSNTFPHSTGIASSASSMSALGLCLADFLQDRGWLDVTENALLREASRLSRLASGSACRSVYGSYTIWGRAPQFPGTSDEYAIPVPFSVHPVFHAMKDAILVVSSREKEVSSRAGHGLMNDHPYAVKRFELAIGNLMELSQAMQEGDLEKFVGITESEALGLHGLMMTSNPSYLLIEPNTVNIVNRIRYFRKETGIPVCFTLDAGPNVHMLYPAQYEIRINEWINVDLVKYCEQDKWIDDEIGKGPQKIK